MTTEKMKGMFPLILLKQIIDFTGCGWMSDNFTWYQHEVFLAKLLRANILGIILWGAVYMCLTTQTCMCVDTE